MYALKGMGHICIKRYGGTYALKGMGHIQYALKGAGMGNTCTKKV